MIEYNPCIGLKRHHKPSSSKITLQGEHNHHVTISLDEETKGLIERFNNAIEVIGKQLDALQKTSAKPTELSMNIPEPERMYKAVPGPKWNETVNIKWREEDGNLIIKYKNGTVSTDWQTVKRLASMGESDRFQAIRTILEEDFTANKRTAYSQFAEHLSRGKIKAPVENSIFEDVDPFAPMLTCMGLTKIDPNCGNGEECT